MAHPPHHPDTHPGSAEDTGPGSDGGSTTGTSPWVYVFWTIGILAVALFVGLHLTGTVGPGAR